MKTITLILAIVITLITTTQETPTQEKLKIDIERTIMEQSTKTMIQIDRDVEKQRKINNEILVYLRNSHQNKNKKN